MTFLHALTCVMLTYGPFFVAYQYSTLKDYPWSAVTTSGAGYLAAQACKQFIIAAFVPPLAEDYAFAWSYELAVTFVSIIEIVALQRTMYYLRRHSHDAQILLLGLGWALADALLKYLIPFIVRARGMEFSWEFIEMALTANVNIVLYVALARAMFLFSRRDAGSVTHYFCGATAAVYVALPSALVFAINVLSLGRFTALAVKLVVSIALNVASRAFLHQYPKYKAKEA